MNIQPRTNSDRHPYIRQGFYWQCFGHMDTDKYTDAFRERLRDNAKKDFDSKAYKGTESIGLKSN